jgi:uncharacterized protein (DUF2062 family)
VNTPLRPQNLWYRRWWRISVHAVRGVTRLQDTPHRIATGVACGLFSSVLPILGQTVVGIVLTRLLRGNIVASLPWSWISNPVTSPLIFYGCYRVGILLIPGQEVLSWVQMEAMVTKFQAMGFREALAEAAGVFAGAALPLGLGSLLVGAIVGGIGYAGAWGVVTTIQQRRARSTG